MKLTEKKLSKVHRVLVYGEPKSGKTELVGALSSKFNLLFFDLENGYATLLKLPAAQQERIELISIPDTKVFPIAIETMLKVITGKSITICEEHGKAGCPLCTKEGKPVSTVELNALDNNTIVVVDSLTQLSNSAMNHLTKTQEDTYKPEWTDYRNQGQLLDKFLSQIQQAKYNICCITHVVETELEDGRKKLVPVCGTTAFSRNTAKYFDHVVYCEVKNKKHNFASSTCYANNIMSGSRTDITIEGKVVPTLLDIFTSNAELPPTPAQNALQALKGIAIAKDKIGTLQNRPGNTGQTPSK
jgi:hypothetical protein